jgi:hypothetical protein
MVSRVPPYDIFSLIKNNIFYRYKNYKNHFENSNFGHVTYSFINMLLVTSLAGLHMYIYYHSDNMFIGNLLENSDLPIPIHSTHVFFSAPKSPIFNSYKGQCIYIKLAFAVVPTDKICGVDLGFEPRSGQTRVY